MTTHVDRSAQYAALTREQQEIVLDGGDVRHLPLQCEYCDQPAAWSTAEDGRAVLACVDVRHIAYSQSWGSAADPADPYLRALAAMLADTRPCEQCGARGRITVTAEALDGSAIYGWQCTNPSGVTHVPPF